MKDIIIAFKHSEVLAKKIAKKVNMPYQTIQVTMFPDGESLLKIPEIVKNRKVFIVSSLHHPNEKLVETILAAETCRDLKARKIILIAPYLCYMRQDIRFHPGESVSSKIIAKHINASFDATITIDPHLHRIQKLSQLYTQGKALSAVSFIADYVKKKYRNPLIIGPDAESYQWVLKIAKRVKCPVTILKKTRYSSRKVSVDIEDRKIDFRNKQVIIIDDIISTGHTMMEVIKFFRRNKVKKITCIGVHAMFAEHAYEKMKKAGASEIITCNTIPHKSNKIDMSRILGKEILKIR